MSFDKSAELMLTNDSKKLSAKEAVRTLKLRGGAMLNNIVEFKIDIQKAIVETNEWAF